MKLNETGRLKGQKQVNVAAGKELKAQVWPTSGL